MSSCLHHKKPQALSAHVLTCRRVITWKIDGHILKKMVSGSGSDENKSYC